MIKQYAFFLLALGSFAACNSTPEATNVAANETTVATTTPEKEVSLNKDAKWRADASTAKNVSLLQQKAVELNKGAKATAADYHTISNELQTGINQLIKECRMKGADHDALHLWLEPLMGEVKELKTVSTTDKGETLFHSIRTRLLDYDLYFQ